MYPDTYYKVLKPIYRDTRWREYRTDEETGRSYSYVWQAVEWELVGYAESMADAKAKYGITNPILEPVGFFPKEIDPPKAPPRKLDTIVTAEQREFRERQYAFA